jgi:NADPH:quinone reductase-like Zn-dependent oxidoreductase
MKTERPGVDVAGVAVGRMVTQFKPGAAVFGGGKGGIAEYACAREAKLAPKPDSVSFKQAAAGLLSVPWVSIIHSKMSGSSGSTLEDYFSTSK